MPKSLDDLLRDIHDCRRCVESPIGKPLPHEPRPVLRASATARIAIAGQAPGTRVHASGIPFTDPSGDRLRQWMGVTEDEFYDTSRVAIIPMGFCFPGLDAKKGDLPPRRECAPMWRDKVFTLLPRVELILLIGQYAQRWHLDKAEIRGGLTATVVRFHETMPTDGHKRTRCRSHPRHIPLPHPSWRNNAWIKRNPWFEADVIPYLQQEVRRLLSP
ncbi:MAG: uracil-DNA glycosylase family protein [Hyphomicrobiaceae bacterium]